MRFERFLLLFFGMGILVVMVAAIISLCRVYL